MKKIIILFFACHCLLHGATKRVLITGGAGFMGSNFTQYMYENYPEYEIAVLDLLTYSGRLENISDTIRQSPRFSFIHGSICDVEVVDRAFQTADFIVHFAAETDVSRSISDDEVFFETNVMGTRNLMHYLVKYKDRIERFVHISTSEVYGTCESNDMDEAHPLNPRSPYAASKLGADRTVYAYGCTYDLPVTILRIFNNYGPNQYVEKVIPKFITFAISGEPLVIHGSGEQTRDFIHVTDMARAVDAVLHSRCYELIKNEVINCGSGKTTSVAQIAKIVSDTFQLGDVKIIHGTDRPGQVEKHISSTAKAKKLLGWEPLIPFEQGIQMTIEWYKQHPEFWEKSFHDEQIRKDNNLLLCEKNRP